MTLHIATARMGIRDPDYLDISLQGNMRRVDKGEGAHRGIGIFFAPSPDLLYPFLSKRKHRGLTDADWAAYADGYRAEMRVSYRERRRAWDTLLSWERVVCVCFCATKAPEPLRCHRRLLAEILGKLGAVDEGELQP